MNQDISSILKHEKPAWLDMDLEEILDLEDMFENLLILADTQEDEKEV